MADVPLNDASDPKRRDALVESVLDRLLRVGIDGFGPMDSARSVAGLAIASTPDAEAAIDKIIRSHVKLAASGGFVTGLGGFITLPVALPANVLSFYVLATRMVAAIAAARGHDISREDVRTAVLLTLSGDDSTSILRKAGVATGTGRMTSYALRGLPPAALMAVNTGVAFRIVVQLGQKGFARLGRALPLAGGAIGGGLDALLMRSLGKRARAEFAAVPRDELDQRPSSA
jgi:hypothetical protein